METVEVKVRDIVAMEAGWHGHWHQRKFVRVARFMRLHVHRGTEITNRVAAHDLRRRRGVIDECHLEFIPIRLP